MSPYQKAEVRRQLELLWAKGFRRVRHGACIGSDDQFGRIAKSIGFYVIAHPGFSPKNPENLLYRAETEYCDEVLEPKPHLKRDRDIVNESHLMLATPVGKEEVQSGTWTTIRYARKVGREHVIINRQ
jgi:hypothetical protein